jgi:hypothetical protein
LRCTLAAIISVCAAVAAVSEAAADDDVGIIITNSAYSHVAPVKYAYKDGEAMAAAMQVFGIDNAEKYKDVTKSWLDILFGPENEPAGLVWKRVEQAKARNPKARLIVYYSGHGAPYKRRGHSEYEAGLLGVDATFIDLERGAYSLQTLRDNLKAIKNELLPEGQVILILEACFSGRSGDGEPLQRDSAQSGMTLPRSAPPEDIIEIDAAQVSEAAYWDNSSQRGMFTDQFVWGVHGAADKREFGGNGDGKVTIEELKTFLQKRLPERVDRNGLGSNVQQNPFFTARDDRYVLSSAPWPRRRDMLEVELQEGAMCEVLQSGGNFSTVEQYRDAQKKLQDYDKNCNSCGCRAEVRRRLGGIDDQLRICDFVRNAIDNGTDPSFLDGLGRRNECPPLLPLLRQRMDGLCKQDRDRWSSAKAGSLDTMKSVADRILCKPVRDQAQEEIRKRVEGEAAVAAMQSAAEDLGTLQPGHLEVRRGAVGGSDPARAYKFQLTDADTVGITLADQDNNLTVDLRDSSWQIVATPRLGEPQLKEIEPSVKLRSGTTYYIRIVPADPRRNAAYTLRAAREAIDTAGPTPETARDLGVLRPGSSQTIAEHVGGSDRGDVFKFTAQEKMLLKVTLTGMTSDVQLDLLNQREQVIQSPSSHSGAHQSLESAVEAQSTYYISVKPAGDYTAYSLAIALSPLPFSRSDIAAPLNVARPHLGHLAPNADEYYAKFTVRDGASISIDLRWADRQTELSLDLLREGAGWRAPKGSYAVGPTGRSITDDLGPGTYLVRVRRSAVLSAAAEFTLSLRSQALCPRAQVIVTVPENEEYSCKFEVTERSRVVAAVMGDPGADLHLEVKGRETYASKSAIDRALDPGSYGFRAHRDSSSRGAVAFRFALTELSFDYHANVDIMYGDFPDGTMRGIGDEAACEQTCRGKPGCIGYSYFKFHQTCYLKRTMEGAYLRKDPVLNSAILHGERLPEGTPLTLDKMNGPRSWRYGGDPLPPVPGVSTGPRGRTQPSGDSCARACYLESGCVGVNHYPARPRDNCEMFKRLDREAADATVQSYWRGQAGPN